MSHLRVDDLDVHVVERGAGEPILFVHGNWASSRWWERVVDRLPAGYRAIAFDLRGRGATRGPDGDYSIPSLAADLRRLIDALGIAPTHVVGHSLGGAIALQLALDAPGALRTLVVIAPAWVDGMPTEYADPATALALHDDPERLRTALSLIAPTAPQDRLWRRLVADARRQRPTATLANLSALVEWRPGDRLRAIAVPSLVISGALDQLTGGPVAVRAAEALGAALVVLEGVGHSPPVEAPGQVAQLIVDHIRRASIPRSGVMEGGRHGRS